MSYIKNGQNTTLSGVSSVRTIMSAYRYMHLNSWSVVHYSSDKLKNFKHIMELIEFMMNYNVYTNAKYEKYVISKIHCCFEHLLYSVFEFRKKKKELIIF